MRRCSVQSTPASGVAHRHPRWPLDDQRRTDSTGRYRTRRSNTALLSPAKLAPTDPGPRPSRRGHRLGRVSGQLSPTHRRRARTSCPRQRQSTTWTNGRWCAVMATGPPEPAARPPLAVGPATPRWLHASTACAGPARHELATSWHDTARQPRSGPLPAPEAKPSYGSDGVRHGEFRPSRRSRWHSAQLACAARLRRCGFQNEKGAGPLTSCSCLRPQQTPPN